MKFFMRSMLLCTAFLTFSLPASSMPVQVEWVNPDEYRDIRPSEESKKRFRERTFEKLNDYFNKLAEQLPEDYQLLINVTDVDLAGHVEFARTREIRIVRPIHFPKMSLTYQLFDGEKQLLSKESVDLKEMNFLLNLKTRVRNKTLGYEKEMIGKWFNKTFEPYFVKAKSA